MKKRYLILAGILALSLTAAGCGKKEDKVTQQPEVTATPAPTAAPTGGALVEMQKSEDSDITNVIGEKTAAASKAVIVNNTGDEVAAIYVRPTIDDDEEWGDELVQGRFVLKNGEKALYYFDPNEKDAYGNTASTYDIRIVYTDEDKYECYFRMLPLKTISQITLCMDGTGEDAIPYARYLSGSSKTETSTLNEVKQRLGLTDSEDDENKDDEDEEEVMPTATPEPAEPSETPDATPTPAVTEAPEEPGDDPSEEEPPKSDLQSAAEGCIGQSLDALISACGDPIGSDYQEEPETGETGYHYYDSFTVSTTVDADGNEIVAGVW
ncbi:MAG: hypothetical protein Q4C77_16365 [Eubacteriales bacterium]|nr:hypothetical protein [Eubacteriales bacterium]